MAFTSFPKFWRDTLLATGLLALLFAVLEPPPTAHLSFPAALGSWVLHIGVGIACALVAANLLFRAWPRLLRWPWLGLGLAGLLGAALFAPVALQLEALHEPAPRELADGWVDSLEARGGAWRLLAEFLSLLPSYLFAWLLVNAPSMRRVSRPRRVDGLAAGTPAGPDAPASASAEGDAVSGGAKSTLTSGDRLLDRLPLAVGRQLVSISADLHYLNVVTRRGRATVLGSLGEAERELGECGVRIHRSHWVARDAIRRLRRTAGGWRCELMDGRSLPVSRRRAADVKRLMGSDFVVEG